MACGSCGGARTRRTVTAGGQQRLATTKEVAYVWRWLPFAAGVEPKDFDTRKEANAWVKEGNPGSVVGQPVS
jgi:hypothetical protein